MVVQKILSELGFARLKDLGIARWCFRAKTQIWVVWLTKNATRRFVPRFSWHDNDAFMRFLFYLFPALVCRFRWVPLLFFGSAGCLQIRVFCLCGLSAIFVPVGSRRCRNSMLCLVRWQSIVFRWCRRFRFLHILKQVQDDARCVQVYVLFVQVYVRCVHSQWRWVQILFCWLHCCLRLDIAWYIFLLHRFLINVAGEVVRQDLEGFENFQGLLDNFT